MCLLAPCEGFVVTHPVPVCIPPIFRYQDGRWFPLAAPSMNSPPDLSACLAKFGVMTSVFSWGGGRSPAQLPPCLQQAKQLPRRKEGRLPHSCSRSSGARETLTGPHMNGLCSNLTSNQKNVTGSSTATANQKNIHTQQEHIVNDQGGQLCGLAIFAVLPVEHSRKSAVEKNRQRFTRSNSQNLVYNAMLCQGSWAGSSV